MKLLERGIYFLTGYVDNDCEVPFIQTLVYLRAAKQEGVVEHSFADAIAWYRNQEHEAGLESSDTLIVADGDLETVKDLAGLVEELTALMK